MPTVPRNTLWAAGSARKRLAIERSRVSGMYRAKGTDQRGLMNFTAPGEMTGEIASESLVNCW